MTKIQKLKEIYLQNNKDNFNQQEFFFWLEEQRLEGDLNMLIYNYAMKENIKSYTNFVKTMLKNIDSIDLDFEVGYCYKRAMEDEFKDNSYWVWCYRFLKDLAKERGVKTYR